MQRRFLIPLFLMTASAHGATPRACDLLTAQQVSPVLAGKSSPGLEHDTGPQHKCSFADPNQSKHIDLSIESVDVFGGADVLKQSMSLPARAGITRETVSGLGDFAVYDADSDGNYSVTLLYHGYFVGISFSNSTAVPGLKAPLIQLAKQVNAKL